MVMKRTMAILLLVFLLAACGTTEAEPTATPTPEPETAESAVDPMTQLLEPEPAVDVMEGFMQWDEAPEMTIDPDAIYLATFETEAGNFQVELLASEAPVTVNNFIFLAEQGFYDDTTFHRVIPGFMAQGGDPSGTGMGGPGYFFEDEISFDLLFDGPGYLAMANAGSDTNGSQFFITYVPTLYLNGVHTIFGVVVDGMDVVEELTPRDPEEAPDYEGSALYTVTIEEIEESLIPEPDVETDVVSPELEEGRPLADLTVEEREDLYTGMPDMVIDPEQTYIAYVETTQGDVTITLDPTAAPMTVNNFFVLANLGYFDDFPIVYVEPEIFIVTGSPGNEIASDVGYVVPAELSLSNTTGAIGMWFIQDSLASSGSQIYFLLQDVVNLDGFFTVFGYVDEGLDVLGELTAEDSIIRIDVEAVQE